MILAVAPVVALLVASLVHVAWPASCALRLLQPTPPVDTDELVALIDAGGF